MANLKLEENEEVKNIVKDVLVYADNNKYTLDVFVTNKRIVLLKDVNKELTFNTFLNARGTSIPENLEVVFNQNLDNIKEYTYENEENIIIFNDNHVLKLKCVKIL